MSTDKVSQWYDDNVDFEYKRLDLGRLEKEVTLHYIHEAIQAVREQDKREEGLKIADIGCGTGVYAIPLAVEGHHLSICDISSAEISLANHKAKEAGIELAATSAFDARDLRKHPEIFKANCYDIVVLLGPLYHILDGTERAEVLSAALETVKPGGFLLTAFVTRNAHLRDIATREPERISKEWGFYGQYLKDGKYTRGTNAPMHHSTLTEIRQLMATVLGKDVGARVVKLVSCEGFLGFQHGSHLAKLDDETFGKWLEIVLESAADEATLGAADHILAVIQKAA